MFGHRTLKETSRKMRHFLWAKTSLSVVASRWFFCSPTNSNTPLLFRAQCLAHGRDSINTSELLCKYFTEWKKRTQEFHRWNWQTLEKERKHDKAIKIMSTDIYIKDLRLVVSTERSPTIYLKHYYSSTLIWSDFHLSCFKYLTSNH